MYFKTKFDWLWQVLWTTSLWRRMKRETKSYSLYWIPLYCLEMPAWRPVDCEFNYCSNLKKIMIMVNCILFCMIILFFHTCLILFAFSLTYTPCRDCAGVEYLNITMYENQTDPEIPPANSTDVIIINIQSINDPPIPFAAYNGKLLLMDDITEPIVVGILFIWFFLGIIKVLF